MGAYYDYVKEICRHHILITNRSLLQSHLHVFSGHEEPQGPEEKLRTELEALVAHLTAANIKQARVPLFEVMIERG